MRGSAAASRRPARPARLRRRSRWCRDVNNHESEARQCSWERRETNQQHDGTTLLARTCGGGGCGRGGCAASRGDAPQHDCAGLRRRRRRHAHVHCTRATRRRVHAPAFRSLVASRGARCSRLAACVCSLARRTRRFEGACLAAGRAGHAACGGRVPWRCRALQELVQHAELQRAEVLELLAGLRGACGGRRRGTRQERSLGWDSSSATGWQHSRCSLQMSGWSDCCSAALLLSLRGRALTPPGSAPRRAGGRQRCCLA